MPKVLLFLVFSLVSEALWAERFEATVHELDPGAPGEEQLLKLEDGRVVFLKPEEKLLNHELLPGQRVELETDEDHTVLSIASLPAEEDPGEELPPMSVEEAPTILPSYAAAQRIFNGMNTSWYQQTECTDRAQIWAFEEDRKHQLKSRKVFLFFTNTYIRAYRYNWWFHVSPYVMVNEGGEQPVERVMDRRFIRQPFGMKSWTDVFIYSRRTCPSSTYNHYRANRNGAEHCYLVRSAMYYRLPLHVEALENRGAVKTQWNQAEINFSYRAFRRRGVR
jgi:hypothetical protein